MIYLSSSPRLVLMAIMWLLVIPLIIFRMHLMFVEVVILILKYPTLLQLSNLSSESALTQAEREYQDANIDSIIQQHLATSSLEHSVDQLTGFIMATDIGMIVPASVTIASHQAFSVISIFS